MNTNCCFATLLLLPPVLFPLLWLPVSSFLCPVASVPSGGPEQYLLLQTPLMFTEQMQQDVIMVLKFPSNSPVTHVAANTQPGLTVPAIITVTANRLFAVNKWHGLTGQSTTCVQPKVFACKSHDRLISSKYSTASITNAELFPYSSSRPRCLIFPCRPPPNRIDIDLGDG